MAKKSLAGREPVFVPAAAHAAGRALLLLLIALVNPFDISDWSEAKTRAIWQVLYAPHYEPLGEDSRRDARDDILVVMVDDVIHRAERRKGRPDGLDFAQVLEDVTRMDVTGPSALGAKPKAVFVDIKLAGAAPAEVKTGSLLEPLPEDVACDELAVAQGKAASPFRCLLARAALITAYKYWPKDGDCQHDTLAKLRCIKMAGGIPLLFADSEISTPANGGTPGRRALDTVAAVVPVYIDQTHYPLVERVENRETLSPAAAMYAVHCMTKSCSPQPFVGGQVAGEPAVWSRTQYRRPIDVSWAVGRTSEFTDLQWRFTGDDAAKKNCAIDRTSTWATAVLLFNLFIDRRPESGAEQPCLYTNTLSDGALQQIGVDEIERWLGGHFVLIGAQSDVNDKVPSPPYGELPGVYYHAMALDNLIKRESHYPGSAVVSAPRHGLPSGDLKKVAANFLVAFLLALLARWLVRVDAMRNSQWPGPRGWLWRLAMLPLAATALLWWLSRLSRGSGLIPEDFDTVEIVVVALLGLLDLVRVILDPVWNWLAGHFPGLRYLKLGRFYAPDHDDGHRRSA